MNFQPTPHMSAAGCLEANLIRSTFAERLLLAGRRPIVASANDPLRSFSPSPHRAMTAVFCYAIKQKGSRVAAARVGARHLYRRTKARRHAHFSVSDSKQGIDTIDTARRCLCLAI
jgi:hypothetical protein